jgi:tRNA/tmRNA/rRNA uracil-C5-methylase (TrmA/RlmC/RlmD family)
VVAEQLLRLGGVSHDVEVAALPDDDGLGWRTRMRYSVTADGRPGLLRHGTHDVIQVRRCLIADPRIQATDLLGQTWSGCDSVSVVAPSVGGEVVVSQHPGPRAAPVTELAGGRTWQVSAGGFWQVHRGGADALRDAVVAMGRPGIGEHAVDLYTGVGLLADALAAHLGPGGRVDAVEGDRRAASDARTNLSAADHAARVVVHEAAVEDFVRGRALRRCDLVVLDPPRRGARRRVVEGLCRWRPRRVVYVACDPASLARDVATFRGLGYDLQEVRGLDLFPMTHHVECVALLVRAGVADREPLELS